MTQHKNSVTAIIQARMSSTRLPGKIMLDLCGKTVLQHVIERVSRVKKIDKIVVATTDLPSDDIIENWCKDNNINYYRGSCDNVLSRYYNSAKKYKSDIIIRITSDCPLLSPKVLSAMLDQFLQTTPDYLNNTLTRTFPRGLDAEIFTFKALEKTYLQAKQGYQKEHVTPYIYQNPDIFKIKCYTDKANNSHHRWTLDTQEDWQLIKKIYNRLYEGHIFEYEDILAIFDKNPELFKINEHIEQKKLKTLPI